MQFADLRPVLVAGKLTADTNECQYPIERNNSTNRTPDFRARSLIPYFPVQLFSLPEDLSPRANTIPSRQGMRERERERVDFAEGSARCIFRFPLNNKDRVL